LWGRPSTPPDPAEVTSDLAEISSALGRVPTVQREALILHHLVGLSIDEIARETRTPSGTVKARLARGRAALSRALSLESSRD
jgi:RNA polymerase sigma-70 factor, ECF subfamily